MKGMLEHAKQQFDASFPLARFQRDGAQHEYTLLLDGRETASAVVTIPKRPPPSSSTLWRWFVILGAGSALLLVVLVRSKEPR